MSNPNLVTRHIEPLVGLSLPATVYTDSGTIGVGVAVGVGEPQAYAITPVSLGTVVSITAGASKTITVGTAVPVGNLVTVHAALRGAVISSVTDARGNTYTVNPNVTNPTATPPSASSAQSILTTALQVGDLMTINFDVSTSSRYAIEAFAWSGVSWIGVDKVATNIGTTSGLNATTIGGILPSNTQTRGLVINTFATSPGGNTSAQPSGNPNVLLSGALSSGGGTPTNLGVTYIIGDASGSYKPGVQYSGNNTPWAAVTQTLAISIPTVDAATIPVAVGFSAAEVFTGITAYTDAATIPVSVVPSVVEQKEIIETVSWSVKVTFSLVEVPPPTAITDAWTAYVDVIPSVVELLAKEYGDSGSIYVKVSMDLHECFNHPTPNYVVTEMKRWEIEEQLERWLSEEVGKRWVVNEVVGAFDNSC